MAHRTTLLLDEETRQAARQLASRQACSASEAIRRAVVRQRDVVFGIPDAQRRARVQVLERLFDLFDGHDAEDEIRRLKAQNEGF